MFEYLDVDYVCVFFVIFNMIYIALFCFVIIVPLSKLPSI